MATSVLGPRARARKRRILNAAQSLFARQGLERTTVEDLLQEAGVARATFYRAFSNMDEVVAALYDEYSDHVIHRLQRSLEQEGATGDWLLRVVDDALEDAQRQGPILGAIFREELRPESVLSRFESGRVHRQVELIGEWWHKSTGAPGDKELITCLVLMLQNLTVRVSMGSYSKRERKRFARAAQTIIQATVDAYAGDLEQASINTPALNLKSIQASAGSSSSSGSA